MEVLRRLRLPDAKSAISKFGSNASRKERELPLPPPEAALAVSAAKDGGKEAADTAVVDKVKSAESPQSVPRKKRGKQPIAPKPDENASVIPTGSGARPKPSKPSTFAGSPKRNASPNSTRSRRSKGRNYKPSGQAKVGRGGGAACAAQDPPGNVQRNQSIVASHPSPGSSSASLSPPRVNPVSKITKKNDPDFKKVNVKGSKAAVEAQQGAMILDKPGATVPGGAGTNYPSPEASHSSQASTTSLGARPAIMVGRGPLGMERRATPAPYVTQSPSGADAKRSAAIVMSSLLHDGDGAGVIGELEGADCDDANAAGEESTDERMMMNQETPRTRNGATVVANETLSGGAKLPLYAGHNSSASLECSQSTMNHSFVTNNASCTTDDDEASLPDVPQALGAELPKHGDPQQPQPNNPNDSTTSLGRQSTTSAAMRRRGRSHSRTRQRTSDAVPTTVSVGGGTGASASACPGSPSRTLTRSRSQRRQRRSRSRSKSRTRSNSADVPSASPQKDLGSASACSPGANDGDAARLSPSGRRPQRGPPVTKRTHAQKMSMKNAIKAADLDILAPVSSKATVSLPATTTSSDSPSVTSAAARPSAAALASSPPTAATALAETARWKAPEHGVGRTYAPSELTHPAAAAEPSDGDVNDHPSGNGAAATAPAVAATASGDTPAPKKTNPVRALTQGLLKRRPSFGGSAVAGVLLRSTGTTKGATSSPPSTASGLAGQ